jgi:hypothetical protein
MATLEEMADDAAAATATAAAAAANNNDGAPFGFRPPAAPGASGSVIKGVQIKRAGKFGTEGVRSALAVAAATPKAPALVPAAPKPAVSISVPKFSIPAAAGAVKPKPKVTFAPAAPPSLEVSELGTAAAPKDGEGEAAAVEGEAAAATEAPKVSVGEVLAAAEGAGAGPDAAAAKADEDAAAAEFKKRLRSVARITLTQPPPLDEDDEADAALITTAVKMMGKKSDRSGQTIKALVEANPIEIYPEEKIYRPISSSTFSNFIVQTYNQYSPTLLKVLREGADALKKPKEFDRDACKKRDPNKVENFYYQKFVRDYLNKDSPYRGLLIYHGLGTGKTCTSIAAAEALYWGGKKTIFVLTPATLSNNYRRELGKCGFFPLRSNNYWSFMKVKDIAKPDKDMSKDLGFYWLENVLGLPPSIIYKQGGGWVPNPDKPSNWADLSPEIKESIRAQQAEHLNYRFKFIHYNGVTPTVLAQLAMSGVREGKSMFDDAVVVVDEIHNLVRTINGTAIGGKPMATIIDQVEPREYTWSAPLGRQRPGFRYPRGYTLYRLLQNAVGAKIIALSATPMINYAQEMAILMNLVGGEQRVAEISLRSMARDMATVKRLETWAKTRADIDFFSIEEAVDKSTVLNVTPVPFNFAKVVGTAADGTVEVRGFVRVPDADAVKVKLSRERNMDAWAVSLVRDLEEQGLLTPGGAAEAEAAVQAARALGPGSPLTTPAFRLHTFPMLPEDPKVFVSNFVDRNTLAIMNANVLKARCTGLVSYYRGGSEELMPRARSQIVEVPMSEEMFIEYAKARGKELELEAPAEKPEEGAATEARRRKGMTAAEMDLYAQATKSVQSGFLTLSRAACNWTWPPEVSRAKIEEMERMDTRERAKLLGVEQDRILAADGVDVDVDMEVGGAGAGSGAPKKKAAGGAGKAAAVSGAEAAEGEGAEETAAVLPDDPGIAALSAPPPVEPAHGSVIATLMAELEAHADSYLNEDLAKYSSKYFAMLENIRMSAGPVLVYSQFKTLEGLGIFAAALRAAPEGYVQLDIQKAPDGEWEIPPDVMDALTTEVPGPDGEERRPPSYILYTGDQGLDKRRLLLQLYNADVGGLPERLSEQCQELLDGADDNRDGRVCRVFMITQSGAEGISLFNTRQVHIMEPYWNNVRLQQVIGRAIRLCSHMNLPWDDRVVDVFTYLSVFTDTQKASGAKQVMMADKGKTTDEIIFEIATKKQMLADSLSEIAQSAAVDCELHFHEHGEVTKCFRFEEGRRPMFMYHPDWHKDIQGGSVRATTAAAAGGAGATASAKFGGR